MTYSSAAQIAADAEGLRVVNDGDVNGTAPQQERREIDVAVTAREYLSIPRTACEPFIAVDHGKRRSVVLHRDGTLLIGGPSGYNKTTAAIQATGALASDDGGDWLSADVTGGHRVLLALLEGTDDDTSERIAALIPEDALDRVTILDRWRKPLPATKAILDTLSREVRCTNADVLVIDTVASLLSGWTDTRTGIGEEHWPHIERIRSLVGRPLAIILVTHTRKADRSGAKIDEAEEIAGTIVRKVDAAITIRPNGEDGPRRIVTFAKVRSGPRPAAVIATLPDSDSDGPPRLEVVASLGGRPPKEGTEAERIAGWIAAQDAPVQQILLLNSLDLSETTLRRRRPELEALGVIRGTMPGRGSAMFYGTAQQWDVATRVALGAPLTDSPDPPPANPPSGGSGVSAGQTPDEHGVSNPPPATSATTPLTGQKTRMNTGFSQTRQPATYYVGQTPGGGSDPAAAGTTPNGTPHTHPSTTSKEQHSA